MDIQTTNNTKVQSPANNSFAEKTFEAFKSLETVQTQHASSKKIAEQNMIDLAMQSFDASKIRYASKGKIDNASTNNKVGLKTVYRYKTTEELKKSTFVASSEQDFADLKANFSAKGLSRYSYGLTKRPTQGKSATRFEMLQEVRSNFKSRKNSNGTKGILSADSSIKQGETLQELKTAKIDSMLKAQAKISEVVIDQTTEATPKASKPSLTVSFASIIADAWKTEKASKEAKIDHAKVLADEFKVAKAKTEKTAKVLEIKDIFPIVVEESGQLAFDLA